MNRTRDYYRKMRAKYIKRKKRICSEAYTNLGGKLYDNDGQYSKNKIHCSCWMCRFSGITYSDAKKIARMAAKMAEYKDEDCF